MKKITDLQFVTFVLAGDIFPLLCLKGGISVMTAVGFAAGTVVQFLLAVPLIILSETSISKSRPMKIFYSLCLVIWGGLFISMLWDTSAVIYIPGENKGIYGKLLIAAITAAVCVYISSEGIKAVSRASFIAGVCGIICLTVAVVSCLSGGEWKNLLRAETERNIFSEITHGLALSGGTACFTILLNETETHRLKRTISYFTVKASVSAVVLIIAAVTAGGIMMITKFPVITAAQLSQPFQSQRIDALFLIVFAVFAVFSLSAQMVTARHILNNAIPEKILFFLLPAAMLTAGLILSSFRPGQGITAVFTVITLLAAPADILIRRRSKREA